MDYSWRKGEPAPGSLTTPCCRFPGSQILIFALHGSFGPGELWFGAWLIEQLCLEADRRSRREALQKAIKGEQRLHRKEPRYNLGDSRKKVIMDYANNYNTSGPRC
jgi:hypothetical protein